MSIETFKAIIGETSFTDAQLEVLLDRATSMALNHYFWGEGDIPSAEERENFINRYEYEIYYIANTILDITKYDGLKEF